MGDHAVEWVVCTAPAVVHVDVIIHTVSQYEPPNGSLPYSWKNDFERRTKGYCAAPSL